MNAKKLPSIHSRVLLISILPLLLLAVIYAAYGTIKPYQDASKNFQANTQSVAGYIAAAAEFGVFYHNQEPLSQLAKSALRNRHIERIIFTDAVGSIIYQQGDSESNDGVELQRLTRGQPYQQGKSWYFSAKIISSSLDVSDYATEEKPAAEEIAGYVIIGASSAETLLSQQQIIINNLIFSVLCLMAAVLLAIRLSRAIIRPVDTLTRLAGDMAAGDLSQRASHFSLQELEILGDSFNYLASQIEQSNQLLNQRIEEATLRLQDNANDLTQQNNDLEDARQKLLQASQAKDEFLAHMSHELRTPLTTVIGFSHLLKKTHLADDQKEHARAIEQASSMLLAIIDDILDVSKIQSNAIFLEESPFDFIRCIEDVISMHTHAAFSKKLELVLLVDPDIPNLLVGDSVRIRQIFNNLLGNAIKFTDAGDVIVTLSVDTLNDNSVHLHASIRDSGVGISAAQQAKLFQPFSQADSSISRRFGGTGLGLMISRQLVQLMGGEIELHSEEGKGTELSFSLHLPLQHPSEISATGLSCRDESLLIYEAHPQSRLALRNMTLDWSTHVFACGDQPLLVQQLAKPQRNNYHCVILGIAAAEITGGHIQSLLSTVRKLYQGPILLLGCMNHIEDILSKDILENYKPIACLSKPLRQEILFSYLNDLSGEQPQARNTRTTNEYYPLQGKSILVAEDNPLNARLIARLLEAAGAQCHSVFNGNEATHAAASNSYDAILMDMHMPEMDGLEATSIIRRQSGLNHNSLIIGLTASALTRDAEAFKVAGADHILNKPIDEDQLIEALLGFHVKQSAASSFKGFLAGNISEQQFHQEIIKHFAEMQASWEDESLQRMYFYCHQLVGLVEAFGDKALAVPLRRLHDSLQLQHYEKVEDHYLATRHAFDSLLLK